MHTITGALITDWCDVMEIGRAGWIHFDDFDLNFCLIPTPPGVVQNKSRNLNRI